MTAIQRRFWVGVLLTALTAVALGCGQPGLEGHPDAGPDASVRADSGSPQDAGLAGDAGQRADAGAGVDAGALADAGQPADAGAPVDAGPALDSGQPVDSGMRVDSGSADSGAPDGGPQDGGIPDGGADGGLGALFDGGAPPLGPPLVAPPGTWTWFDFPNSSCDDGSPTGIGVNVSTASNNLLIYMEGGGACWDYVTCYVFNTAVHGPFGQPQFTNAISSFPSSILDRTVANNPFKDWNLVYVPYCTGDIHGGDSIMMYSGGGAPQTYHHKGHANVLAYLERIGATFPTAGKVVVSGASAGGGGATVNYAYARAYWPVGQTYLLDDSLPLFEGSNIPQARRDAWIASWNLTPLLDTVCGPGCGADLSLVYPALVRRYPADRMAILSYNQDSTIGGYYLLSATQFQADLDSLYVNVMQPHGIRAYFLSGTSHTMVKDPASKVSATGVMLWPWLTQMVTDDPAWVSARP